MNSLLNHICRTKSHRPRNPSNHFDVLLFPAVAVGPVCGKSFDLDFLIAGVDHHPEVDVRGCMRMVEKEYIDD